MQLLEFQSCFVFPPLKILDSLLLKLASLTGHRLLVHVDNQVIELSNASIFVGFAFSAVVCLDDDTGGVFGKITRGPEGFMHDFGDEGKQSVYWNSQLCFRLYSIYRSIQDI